MRQVNAVNGSQMVVKIGVAYYRRKQEHKVTSQKLSSLLYTITTDFSTIKKRHSAAAECLAGFAAGHLSQAQLCLAAGHLSQAQLCLAILITSDFQMISRTKATGREYRQETA